MQDYNDSVMIALLPITTDWCKIRLPHMTLVYCGEIKDRKPGDFNDMAKDASALAAMSSPMMLKVTGVEVFGEDTDKVDVLRLQLTPELAAMRRFVEHWNMSQHPGFKPHCTIGMAGEPHGPLPNYLAFDRLCVYWGEEMINFNLKR